jgi:hypothetical protein
MKTFTSLEADPLCPSAQPDMPGAIVFGVVTGPVERRQVGYLSEPQPVSDEILALSHPVKPTEVFRIAATCSGNACRHFDGTNCGLAQRIVHLLNPVSAGLPPCLIRRDCRWWRQEGKAACLRCPNVVTDSRNATDLQKAVAAPQTTS